MNYTPGELSVQPGIDEGKWHIRNSYGNEVARVETDQDRRVVLSWGPLLSRQERFRDYHGAFEWIRSHGAQIEFGEGEC